MGGLDDVWESMEDLEQSVGSSDLINVEFQWV